MHGKLKFFHMAIFSPLIILVILVTNMRSAFYLYCLYCVVVSFSSLSWHSRQRYMRTVPRLYPRPSIGWRVFLATHRHCVLDPIVSRNPLSRGMIIDSNQNSSLSLSLQVVVRQLNPYPWPLRRAGST